MTNVSLLLFLKPPPLMSYNHVDDNSDHWVRLENELIILKTTTIVMRHWPWPWRRASQWWTLWQGFRTSGERTTAHSWCKELSSWLWSKTSRGFLFCWLSYPPLLSGTDTDYLNLILFYNILGDSTARLPWGILTYGLVLLSVKFSMLKYKAKFANHNIYQYEYQIGICFVRKRYVKK